MKKIRKLRVEQHLTQQELADKIGVTRGAISQYENGRIFPCIPLLPKLAQALNCTVYELLCEDLAENDQTAQEDPERVCGYCKHICGGCTDYSSECALGYGEVWSGRVACSDFMKRGDKND